MARWTKVKFRVFADVSKPAKMKMKEFPMISSAVRTPSGISLSSSIAVVPACSEALMSGPGNC